MKAYIGLESLRLQVVVALETLEVGCGENKAHQDASANEEIREVVLISQDPFPQ